MYKVITTVCALLMSVVLSHSVNAHETTTDSVIPVELGSVFQLPFSKDNVTRPVCGKSTEIERVLADIQKLGPRRAHHLLFHIAEKGRDNLKRGLSYEVQKLLKEECKNLRSVHFSPIKIVRTIDVHNYRVSIVAIYESYRDKEGVFYTWFVNTEFKEMDKTLATQVIASTKNRLVVDPRAPAMVPKGFMITTEHALVNQFLTSASRQPENVAKYVLLRPTKSFVTHKTRDLLLDLDKRGWVQFYQERSIVTFHEFVESRQIHGMNVSVLGLDIETMPSGKKQRFYTWVVDTEIIEPKSKRQASIR